MWFITRPQQSSGATDNVWRFTNCGGISPILRPLGAGLCPTWCRTYQYVFVNTVNPFLTTRKHFIIIIFISTLVKNEHKLNCDNVTTQRTR